MPETPAPATPAAPKFLTFDQMVQPRTFKTADVEIPGRGLLRVRELRARERDAIDHGVSVPSLGENGKVELRRDERGYRAKAVAYASINPDGAAVFPDPEKGAELLNDLWTHREIDVAFQAVDELSLLTRGAADAAGKDSGKTASAAS